MAHHNPHTVPIRPPIVMVHPQGFQLVGREIVTVVPGGRCVRPDNVRSGCHQHEGASLSSESGSIGGCQVGASEPRTPLLGQAGRSGAGDLTGHDNDGGVLGRQGGKEVVHLCGRSISSQVVGGCHGALAGKVRWREGWMTDNEVDG